MATVCYRIWSVNEIGLFGRYLFFIKIIFCIALANFQLQMNEEYLVHFISERAILKLFRIFCLKINICIILVS